MLTCRNSSGGRAPGSPTSRTICSKRAGASSLLIRLNTSSMKRRRCTRFARGPIALVLEALPVAVDRRQVLVEVVGEQQVGGDDAHVLGERPSGDSPMSGRCSGHRSGGQTSVIGSMTAEPMAAREQAEQALRVVSAIGRSPSRGRRPVSMAGTASVVRPATVVAVRYQVASRASDANAG